MATDPVISWRDWANAWREHNGEMERWIEHRRLPLGVTFRDQIDDLVKAIQSGDPRAIAFYEMFCIWRLTR